MGGRYRSVVLGTITVQFLGMLFQKAKWLIIEIHINIHTDHMCYIGQSVVIMFVLTGYNDVTRTFVCWSVYVEDFNSKHFIFICMQMATLVTGFRYLECGCNVSNTLTLRLRYFVIPHPILRVIS